MGVGHNTMKTLVYISLLLHLTGCAARKYLVAVHHLDPKLESKKFKERLLSTGVDTIITYTDACSGCVEGVLNPRYVYWFEAGQGFLTKFTEESNYNIIEPQEFPIVYIVRNFDKIKSDSIIEPNFGFMHYDFEEIFLKIGDKEFDYRLDEFEKTQNQNNFKVLTIDKIRAALFEIPSREWFGQNFKTEKKKITVPNNGYTQSGL